MVWIVPKQNIITPDNAPSCIAVFEASNMRDAVLKADAAYLTGRFNGAVWYRSHPTLVKNPMSDMRNYFNEHNSTTMMNSEPAHTLAGEITYSPHNESYNNLDLITQAFDEERIEDIKHLSELFGRQTASINIRDFITECIHYDIPVWDDEQNQQLFGDHRLRIIRADSVIGTAVYDEDKDFHFDELAYKSGRLKKEDCGTEYHVGLGSYLFIWSHNTLLLHAFPPYDVRGSGHHRYTTLYDCNDPIKRPASSSYQFS